LESLPVHDSQPHLPRPHDCDPSIFSARVILAVKNFARVPGVCHIGLGVTAANTMRMLRKNGVHCEAWSIDNRHGKDHEYKMLQDQLTADAAKGGRPVTHVIVSAPSWIQPNQFSMLSQDWPDIIFVQLNHSGCAYLSIDKYGIRNIREVAAASEMNHNVKVAANNERVCKFINALCGVNSLYLPNLYDLDGFVHHREKRLGGTLRIGSFGASRPWKNQLTAAEGAIMIANELGVNLELYVNSKRPDGGERMIESRLEMFDGLPNAKIVDVPWASWSKFRDITRNMHLLIQPSFDETFNVCTADGIAEGVPSVTTSALEWTPPSWWAHPEDPSDIASRGLGLLTGSHSAIREGRTALEKYVQFGLHRWLEFVKGRRAVLY
jgi:glycosyltransferase involved in cell wall biosynthesis